MNAASDPCSELEMGQLVAEKYQVVRELGRGGMGVVYEARHLDLEVRVAIKVVLACFADSDAVTQRLLGEARAAARVRSEHAVQILDFGVLPNGLPFLVMEYVKGKSVQARLEECQRLALEEVLDVVGQACVGLADAHSKHVVHRDVKPDNLLLEERPDGTTLVKVVDFGLSKRLDDRSLKLTDPSLTMGSPDYMSPEQVMACDSLDARADVWSLGVVLYELATGQSPFPASSVPQLFSMVLTHNVTPPSALVAGLPNAFDTVVLRCLERDRDNRYADAAELLDALMQIQSGAARRPSVLRASVVRRRKSASVERGPAGALQRPPRPSSRSLGSLGLFTGLLIALVAGVSYLLSDDELERGSAPIAEHAEPEGAGAAYAGAAGSGERSAATAAGSAELPATTVVGSPRTKQPSQAASQPSPAVRPTAARPQVVAADKRARQAKPAPPRGSAADRREPNAPNPPALPSSQGHEPTAASSAWDIDQFGGRH